jgi:mannose-1-phosphate guanylyltransferase
LKALLLAAGLGTRLRPVTDFVPKCLVPIHGKVLLEYWLDNLTKAGIEEFVINTHYLHEQVEAYIVSSKYKDMVTLVYEDELLLTGGTLLNNKELLKSNSFMVVHADNLSLCDFGEFIKAHKSRPKECEITMMTFSADRPQDCGILELDTNGIVQNFFEKVKNPPSNLANGAVYIMEESIIEYLESFNKKSIDISLEVIPNYMGRIFTYNNDIYHRDIGNLESYSLAQIDMMSRFLSKKSLEL